ncbi:YccF domain-containing protein [Glaciecola sp. MH2013]|uniref:YccF domain-containing protein n=1 Tax=Glaciecola sp. MH2013 TaxID=2785524 RepID=UPI00189E1CF9|nr:YccF domain-containing protein [Glaciecola sp. MH2013]MBF7073658.1 YccF domain-containing protein [Glaciecola sp. MH2013]
MSLIGNIIWFLFGGLVMGIAWFLWGVLAVVTIVGIPWARSCFVLSKFSFFPFGKEAVSRSAVNQKGDVGTGTLGIIGNVIWFLFGGFWLAMGHLVSGLLCFITIIGIPFAIQHFKLAGVAFFPIGLTIVDKR